MTVITTKEGHIIYGCGHTHNGVIITNSDALTISSYLCWKDDTGFDGNNSECFNCYNKRCDEQSKGSFKEDKRK